MARQLADNALTIYTDGSCYQSPRVGGTGFLFIVVDDSGQPEIHEECPPGWNGATNNQMELQAVIEALGLATGRHPPVPPSRYDKIVICTDSMYVSDNYKNALYRWPSTGWRTKDGAPITNTDQWRQLVKLVKRADRLRKRVDIEWVKGHKSDPYNKRVDKLAKQSANTPSARVLRPARVRRKLSPHSVSPGCVPMAGQLEIVHIVVDEYLRAPHRCYRYMYEIMDQSSVHYQLVDKATSDVLLNAGHFYRVRFNNNPGNPRIEECLEELDRAAVLDDQPE